jgi:hypothetical protein
MIVRAVLFAVVSAAASCAASSIPATTTATATGAATPTAEPSPAIDAGTVAEALTLGDTSCERDLDCVLSGFACSPCGRCPGTLLYGIHRLDLEEAERACDPHPEPAPCSPCQRPDPGFRQWTRVECLDHRCVPTTPGPPLGE